MIARPLNFILRMAVLLSLGLCSGAGAADSIDFAEIERAARFARAAYLGEAETRALAAAEDLELTLRGSVAEIQVTFFVVTDLAGRSQTIAVRGTANAENAMLDIAFKLVDDDRAGVRLHEGFAHSARRVYAALKPALRADFRIRATGHSFGGAVAQILAMYLDADGYDVGRIITFGQPKVTNLAGTERYRHLDLLRVVTPTDLVPLVPPFDPLDIANIDIYWHAGRELILLEGRRYAILEGVDSMLRAANFTQQVPTEENLRTHYMDIYVDLVAARRDASERVGYRNDFNLFNLFGNN